jgi:phosphatidylserine decarboxylase
MFRFARVKTLWIKNSFISWFVSSYKVNLSEADRENVKDYEHFNDFFTRSLKKTSRPISSLPVISPVDGVVSQAGKINKSEIVQAKGKKYSISALLDDKSIDTAYFNSFTTIYLSPKDYHRIHMPCDGDLVSMKYIPGDLFSVNQRTVNGIDQVFARNERLVCFFNTKFGEMAFILVGAIFVGSMQTSWEGQITPPYSKSVQNYNYKEQKIRLNKGDELGRFNMGSTVIILTSNDFPNLSLEEGQALKMGQSIT